MSRHAQFLALFLIISVCQGVDAQYGEWRHHGSFFINTTSSGAELAESVRERQVPVLLRLDGEFFDFDEAQPDGSDIRVSGESGEPLSYQIEQWDAERASAAVWVRVPEIRGDSVQRIRMHWGRPQAKSESSAAAVFAARAGFLSVWHLNRGVVDELGVVDCANVGTASRPGRIAGGRNFDPGQGIRCGENINSYPRGADPSTTSLWIRASSPNVAFIGWGNEGGGRGSKVKMFFRSPPHVHVDSDFADVSSSKGRLALDEWVHVVHTYDRDGNAKLYLNGELDGHTTPTRDIKRPSRMWIGGWYDHFRFVGDIDEVRIASTARSADWIRLQYENQRDLHTLVGPLVRDGDSPSVAGQPIAIDEGTRATIVANARGAEKIYWVLKREGVESVVAVDCLAFGFEPGRVSGDTKMTLSLRTVHGGVLHSSDYPVTVLEKLPDPQVTLAAPTGWNGRNAIELVPRIANADAIAEAGLELEYNWSIAGLATISQHLGSRLRLQRAQNSGVLEVSVSVDSGGAPIVASARIVVREPAIPDRWIERSAGDEEKPADGQFYARDPSGLGTLHYAGVVDEAADSVVLRIFSGKRLHAEAKRALDATKRYALSAPLRSGLVKYRSELWSVAGGKESLLHRAQDLVCGDVYVIQGQSNAEAYDGGRAVHPFKSPWIRSFGSMRQDPKGARTERWGSAVGFHRDYQELQIGYWGMELAKQILEKHRVPVFVINGAKGGSRIDQHQRDADDPTDVRTIYGRLLWRVRRAKLTHGVRAVLWHQGENDQGAAGPSGGYGWQTYTQDFIDLAAAWKTDFPNLQSYYVCQIWPKACAMGIDGSDDRLRDAQRRLPRLFSNMGIISTLGIRPAGSCHYKAEGYARIAQALYPLVARDHYGVDYNRVISPPDLRAARREGRQLVLEFDQPMAWRDEISEQLFVEGRSLAGVTGRVDGESIVLTLPTSLKPDAITYVIGDRWNPREPLLKGRNGLAALTFCEVPVGSP